MAITYTQAKSTLDEIAEKSERARIHSETARNLLVRAEQELSAMSSQYASFVTELDAIANAGSGEAWLTAKAEKDEMVADFNALRARVQALLAAYDSV